MTLTDRPYRPSNGTEGEFFQAHFCYRCVKDEGDGCAILVMSMCYGVNEPEYPREWTYDADGKPTCTAFKEKP